MARKSLNFFSFGSSLVCTRGRGGEGFPRMSPCGSERKRRAGRWPHQVPLNPKEMRFGQALVREDVCFEIQFPPSRRLVKV